MSDQDNQPSKQTSSVPLKKETVRVTLKAADAPAASPTGTRPAPSAPKPTAPAKPPTPTAPPAPKAAPTVGAPPAPTAPIATQGAPAAPGAPKAPAPAPTIALKTSGGGSAPGAPAPTIKLNTGGGPPSAPAAPGKPVPTKPLSPPPTGPALPGAAPAPGPTVALPKATVQLNPPTQPLGTQAPAASQMATMQVSEQDDDSGNGTANVLAILAFIGAAAVVAIQLMTSAVWLGVDDSGKEQKVEWGNLF